MAAMTAGVRPLRQASFHVVHWSLCSAGTHLTSSHQTHSHETAWHSSKESPKQMSPGAIGDDDGVGVSVGVGDGDGDGDDVGVGVGDGDNVGVGDGDDVGVGVDVGDETLQKGGSNPVSHLHDPFASQSPCPLHLPAREHATEHEGPYQLVLHLHTPLATSGHLPWPEQKSGQHPKAVVAFSTRARNLHASRPSASETPTQATAT